MRREAGFTLLEILVALVVLGLVVAGLSQGLRFGLRATERQEQLSSERGDLEAVDRLLRRLVTQLDPGTKRAPAKVQGDADAIGFTTDFGAAASALAITGAETRLTVESGKLVLRWRPALHVTRFTPPPAPEVAVLLDRVQRLELSYWGPRGEEPTTWRSQWRQDKPPLLVRIRLVFPDASGRRWPDIVAAPARPQPAS